jgi:hypothetical protein
MDAMKMLTDFCAAGPEPTADWLSAERAKVTAAIGQTPPRRVTRLRWPVPPRATLVGVTAIAAATALATGVVVATGAQAPKTGAQTVAYVISHTDAAITAAVAGNSVVEVRTSYGPWNKAGIYIGGSSRDSLLAARTDNWYYGSETDYPARTEGFTAAGRPIFDTGQRPGSDTSTVVDDKPGVWWRYTTHVQPWTPPLGSALGCDAVGQFAGVTSNPAFWPGWLHKLMACGEFKTSGTERVDGVDAIKVIQVRPDGIDSTLWVDPSTYLPVRLVTESQNAPGGPYQLKQTDDIRWLPSTAGGLAGLTVPIPSGFVQVPPPPGEGSNNCLGAKPSCLAPWNAWYAKYVAPRLR